VDKTENRKKGDFKKNLTIKHKSNQEKENSSKKLAKA